jgi:predicted RNase H-like HicB family nuclease
LPIRIEPLEEGGYLATSEVLPGFLAQGRTIAETLEIAQDVARKLVESYVEHGDPLPDQLLAKADRRDSFELRIPVPHVQTAHQFPSCSAAPGQAP